MSDAIDWPTDEGIWMGYLENGIGWLPFQTMALRDDLPSKEQLALERAAPETAPPRAILMIVARFPQSAERWPYTVQGCHPAKYWRRPTDAEMEQARHFYGLASKEEPDADQGKDGQRSETSEA